LMVYLCDPLLCQFHSRFAFIFSEMSFLSQVLVLVVIGLEEMGGHSIATKDACLDLYQSMNIAANAQVYAEIAVPILQTMHLMKESQLIPFKPVFPIKLDGCDRDKVRHVVKVHLQGYIKDHLKYDRAEEG